MSDSKLPVLDEELLVKVTDHAVSAPNWKQHIWYRKEEENVCGTVMCVAGFTMIHFLGWEPVNGSDWTEGVIDPVTGLKEWISDSAQEALGLTDVEAYRLFNSDVNANKLIRIRDNIIERNRTGTRF